MSTKSTKDTKKSSRLYSKAAYLVGDKLLIVFFKTFVLFCFSWIKEFFQVDRQFEFEITFYLKIIGENND